MNVTAHDISVIAETLRRNNFSSAEIHRVMCTAWGDVISLRRTQEIAKEFKDGTRTSLDRAEGSGRPVSRERTELVQRIKQDVEEDPHLSCRTLAALHEINHRMVYDILTVDLKMTSVSDRVAPYELTDAAKQERVRCCREMLKARELEKLRDHCEKVIASDGFYLLQCAVALFCSNKLASVASLTCRCSKHADFL